MRHVVSKGHETESRRGSGRGEYINDNRYLDPYGGGYSGSVRQTASYGSSGEEVGYYDGESPYQYEYDQQQQQQGQGGGDPNQQYQPR